MDCVKQYYYTSEYLAENYRIIKDMKDGVSGFGVGHKLKCRGVTKCGENLWEMNPHSIF